MEPPPPSRQTPARPTAKSLISVHFGSVSGSVWGPFWFRSVSGPFRGVGWGRGGVGQRGFCMGKEYHYLSGTGDSQRDSRESFAIETPIFIAHLGAYAMTTKFLDDKICTFKILLSWRFPRKTAFWTIFLSAPHAPSPPQNSKFYFYCRLAVSEHQADSHESLEFPIRVKRANRKCARITPRIRPGKKQ